MSNVSTLFSLFNTTQAQVDCADRIYDGTSRTIFYQVRDEDAVEDYRVDVTADGVVTCSCGDALDCWHRRASLAAQILFELESVEQSNIEALVRKGYTRESATNHAYYGAPLVESPEEPVVSAVVPDPPVVRDRAWEEEEKKVARREARAVRRYGRKAYDSGDFRFMA